MRSILLYLLGQTLAMHMKYDISNIVSIIIAISIITIITIAILRTRSSSTNTTCNNIETKAKINSTITNNTNTNNSSATTTSSDAINRLKLSYESTISSLRIDLEKSRSDIKSLNTTITTIRNDYNNAITTINTTNDKLHTINKRYSILQTAYDTIVLDNTNTKALLVSANSTITTLSTDSISMKLQQEQLLLKLHNKEQELSSLLSSTTNTSTSNTTNDIDNLRANLAAMTINYEHTNSELLLVKQALNDTINTIKRDNDTTTNTDIITAKYTALLNDYKKLQESLLSLQDTNDILQQEITSITNDNNDLKIQLKDTNDCYHHLKSRKDKDKKVSIASEGTTILLI